MVLFVKITKCNILHTKSPITKPFLTFDPPKKIYVKIRYSGYDFGKKPLSSLSRTERRIPILQMSPGGSTRRGRSTASTWQRGEGSGSSAGWSSTWPLGSSGLTTPTTSCYMQIEATTALQLYLFHVISPNVLIYNVLCFLLLQPMQLLQPLHLFTLICKKCNPCILKIYCVHYFVQPNAKSKIMWKKQ